MVIASNRNHAAVLGGTGHIRVLEDIATAVHTRAFAVPDAENAVVLVGLGIEIELLRAPHGGGAQLLIHTGLKNDVVCVQMLLGCNQRLVVATQRGTPVAADETCSVQASGQIAHPLQHG